MEMKEFAKKVCGAVEKKLGSEYRIEVKEVRKNNGVLLHGLLILSRQRNVVPTIYLDSFWEAYESGMPFAAIIRRLLDIYQNDTPKDSVSVEFFRYFEAVKDRICYRLVGKAGNEELLEEMPHIEFLDLALCFYYAYRSRELGDGIILIHNSHMKMWGASTADLLRLARNNTPLLFPWECSTLEDLLRDCTKQRGGDTLFPAEEFPAGEIPMQVLSNEKRLHGAACILYPGVLEKIAAVRQRSLFIIPSSVHEVILLTDMGGGSAEALRRIIREVNRTQVAPEEVLSDNLYYYDFIEKKIKTVSD